jgi:hypothetical protein
MKKLVYILVAVLLYTIPVRAQDKGDTLMLPPVVVSSVRNVDARVNKSFRRAFPNAGNLRWYRINKDYLAKFIKEDMQHQTLFHRNGYIKYDISYGMAHDLTTEIGDRLMRAYKGYMISRVVKVSRNNQLCWIINLEGLRDFVVVRIEGDEMEEVQYFEKPES